VIALEHGPGDPKQGEQVADDVLDEAGVRKKEPGIRCPKCRWRPRKQDRWWCNRPGCGWSWNTFDTKGVCPNCRYQWEWTACLACHAWSLHAEWYGD
jgi:hypothetical protein